ncbi:uncharacterized protein LOC128185352 [Crassostrea angulata]|uniref:uncharacterized protein LOC128185352 n=1 Tax=Magallana angulata TaxID=2784310 RepID=UPI0022B194D5|nr:uncharacterized protein LOC128185352 [Crassostrea angulata]
MPFGLSNAPAVFQELMNIVLQGQEEFAIAYLDDILIFSETPEDHLRHIQDVFNRLRKRGLKMKLKKYLLSRLPTVNLECEEKEQSEHDEPDVKDNFFEVNVLNSNAFSPKRLARCEVKQHDELVKPFIDLPEGINIKESQQHDKQIKKLKNRLNKGTATATGEKRFLEIDGLMYYLSDGDSEGPRLRLYVPRELELLVVQQYHDGLGHMGVDKTYDVIRQKRRYAGEDQHKIALQEQHKAFLLVHRNMKEAKKNKKAQADKKSKDENFQTNYVVPPEDESLSEDDDMQPEPLERAIQYKQWEREESSDEEDIPLAELQRRIRAKKIMDDQQYKHENDQTVDSESDETHESKQCDENSGQDYEIPLDNQNVL